MTRSYWHGSNYLEWLLDRQDVMVHRAPDLKLLGNEEDYQKIMIFFAEVIQLFGKSMEVRQQVIATATVYFKRFYSRTSLKSIDPWLMAPSSLFLASKVEEFGVLSQKNLLAACRNAIHTHYSTYFPDGYVYAYRAQDILECEFILLEAMDCSLIVFHPYRPLVRFCEQLRPQLHELADSVLERAWWIVNDSLRTDVCLYYPPYIIALGCLQTASVLLASNSELIAGLSGSSSSLSSGSNRHNYFSHQQPQPSVDPLAATDQWFSELNVDMEKVLQVSRHLLNLYDLWRRMDESPDSTVALLKKLPRPVIQQPAQSSTTTVGNYVSSSTGGGGGGAASGASQSSGANGSAAVHNHQQQQQQQMMTTNSGGAGGSGNLTDSHRNTTAAQPTAMMRAQQQRQQQQQSHLSGGIRQ